MRKSLGEKRREISPEQIDEITRLHGAFSEDDERVKIVDGTSFGYRTIVVEQPLRARYVLDSSQWTQLPDEKPFDKLDDDARARLARAMWELGNAEVPSEAELRTAITAMAAEAGVSKLSAAVLKALVARCLVRDPDAPPMTDTKGNVIADPDRRDTENVPLDEVVEAYLNREVRPHVPGAWCADHAGKIGYEIPFTRLFYKYTPPRPSAEIKAELKELEGEIHRLLAEVLR